MNFERLRKIIEYSDANRDNMKTKVKNFYSFVGMSSYKEVLNIMQIVRPYFERKDILFWNCRLLMNRLVSFVTKEMLWDISC